MSNLNVFIDDRYTVLKYLIKIPDMVLFLFNPSKEEFYEYIFSKDRLKIKLVDEWASILNELI